LLYGADAPQIILQISSMGVCFYFAITMIQAFIKLRFRQIFRATKGLGLIRIIVLTILSAILVIGLFTQTEKTPNSFYVTGLCLIIITLIQVNRHDKRFLQIHFSNSKLIFLTEYLLLMSPLFICLIYGKQWIPLISSIALTSLIINLDFKIRQKSLNTSFQKMIPSDCFEWKGGVRKTLVLIVALWIIGLGTSFFIGSVPIVLFILGILPWSFNERSEPLHMILAYELGPTKFLIHKIKMQLSLFSILSIPLIIAFLLFHPVKWYIPIAEYFIFITSYIYIILAKYSFYQPNNKSTGAQAWVAIGAMGMIIPVFIPVVWLLSIRFYFKSRNNLNFYLNDYN
jgi:hypothetical protein